MTKCYIHQLHGIYLLFKNYEWRVMFNSVYLVNIGIYINTALKYIWIYICKG